MFKKITLLHLLLSCYLLSAQIVSTVTDGNFHDGLAIDAQGNIYGSDFTGDSVYKYDTNGNVSVFASGFVSPNGIGINSNGEVFICDHFANLIRKYDSNGTLLMTYNSGQFSSPAGIQSIPNSSDMLVVEYNQFIGRKIKRLNADNTVTELYAGAPLNGPAGITFIGNTAYIANFNDRKIFEFSNGTLTEIAQLPSGTNPNTNFLGFLTSANGLLYATHIGRNAIYSIDPNTGITTQFAGSLPGSDDGDISTATFNAPNGILADINTNRIYVSDSGSKNLRIIDNAILSNGDVNANSVDIQVFPNPVKEELTIHFKLSHTEKVILKVNDMSGREILQKAIQPSTLNPFIKVPITSWQKGTYILHFVQNDKKVTKKIII